jgi:hypothetical protein
MLYRMTEWMDDGHGTQAPMTGESVVTASGVSEKKNYGQKDLPWYIHSPEEPHFVNHVPRRSV